MAIHGLTLSSTKRHMSPNDEAFPHAGEGNSNVSLDYSGCSVFVLGPVDGFINTHVLDLSLEFKQGDNPSQTLNLNRMHLETVRFGLRSMEKFQDEHGDEVPFKSQKVIVCGRSYDVVSDDILRQFPLSLIRELANEIRDLSTVRETEAGNSSPQ